MFKKGLSLLFAGLLAVCVAGNCTHVHTEECGENGVDCTHECFSISLFGDEHFEY